MSKRIFIAGHNGMVGAALCRRLSASQASFEIVTANRRELDLTDSKAVGNYFQANEIDEIYLAAAKVGGIHANNMQRVQFLQTNLEIQIAIIKAAHAADINKLLFLGSSCIYPKFAEQPIAEEALLTGALEPTNEPYALAKIAGLKLCEAYNRQYQRDYRSVMPTNLYGAGDNFHPLESHVIPALIRRFHEAKESDAGKVVVWGTGQAYREFMYVDDLADACVYVMDLARDTLGAEITESNQHINVGTGVEHTIAQLCDAIADVVGFKGSIQYDTSKPDGTPRKLLDTGRLNRLGWRCKTDLRSGLEKTYDWFLSHREDLRN